VANSQPVNSNLTAKINTDVADIKTLAADFAKLSSGPATGVCQQLQAAVNAYQADQQLVLQIAQVNDPNTQTKITLLAGLVAGTVDAIIAVIPSCQNAAAAHKMKINPPYIVSNFSDRYNSILVAPTGNAAVDAATPKLRLHRHSAFARAVTFGRLQ
jgi:CTP synthase (UTP-ammonia lyase)